MSGADKITPLKNVSAADDVRRIFVRDLVLPAEIGVHAHEKGTEQKVRINVDLAIRPAEGPLDDDLTNTVCYETIVEGIKSILRRGHVGLVETLAENIAAMALGDERVDVARVRVEKLNAVKEAESVGVEIERNRPPAHRK